MSELLYRQLSYDIVGAAIEVYNSIGSFYDEPSYQKAMEIELNFLGIPYVAKRRFEIEHRGFQIGWAEPDLLVDDSIVVELKLAGPQGSCLGRAAARLDPHRREHRKARADASTLLPKPSQVARPPASLVRGIGRARWSRITGRPNASARPRIVMEATPCMAVKGFLPSDRVGNLLGSY
ncbi:MAG: GxxExxY protein [Acidobacteriota bacterium]